MKIMRILSLSSILLFLSCEKDEKKEISVINSGFVKINKTNQVDIDSLKIFLANFSDVSRDSIVYDENEEFFLWRNRKQINLQDLIEIHNQVNQNK